MQNLIIGEDHETWLKKYNKRKEGKMFNLRFDHEALAKDLSKPQPHKESWVANALWIAVKGTKMEEDGKYFIELLEPDYFKDFDENDHNEP